MLSTLTAPQMLVVTELDEPFLPLPDDLLVNLRDSRGAVDALLEALPAQWPNANMQLPDSATGPALQAAFLVMSHLGGKMLLFQGSAPSLGAGKFKAREALAAYGTEREAALRNPEDPFFKRFAAEASRQQITLDVFVAAPGPVDLASLAAIPRYTCGQVNYYPGFYAARDGARLTADVTRNLSRPTAWEAVMRIRCSRGLRISSFHGHFFNRSTDLLALPTCDPDKTFAVQIAHEETMVSGAVGFVQCALLYTNSNGERRIRVHTLCLPVTGDLAEMYRASDGGATAALLAKLAVEKALMSKLDETRAALQAKLAGALKEYRLLAGAGARAPNALVYPESMRFLAAHALGLVKCTAFRGGGREVNADERTAALHALMEAPADAALSTAYPDVFALHDPAAAG
ncbi:COP-II coat subunit, partial [Raphidocelis subcapitata]